MNIILITTNHNIGTGLQNAFTAENKFVLPRVIIEYSRDALCSHNSVLCL